MRSDLSANGYDLIEGIRGRVTYMQLPDTNHDESLLLQALIAIKVRYFPSRVISASNRVAIGPCRRHRGFSKPAVQRNFLYH